RPAVPRRARPQLSRGTFEAQRDAPRMPEHGSGRSDERSERQAIASRERRRQRAVLGAHVPIAGAEHDRRELHILPIQRRTAGQANFDLRAARRVDAVQARGQRGGIICHDQIAGSQVIDQARARRVRYRALSVDYEQPRIGRPLYRLSGSNHWGKARAIASASSRAATSGRFSVARSALGTASACKGVSMSPGSSDRKRTPSAPSSSPQMPLMWRSAAFDAPYAPHCAYALIAASLDTFSTTAPRPSRAEALKAPSSALVKRNGARTLVASASSNCSQSVSASSASGVGPRLEALLTSTSRPPSAAVICKAMG